ncbi:MAG: LysR family transcriptional regulator [Alphaproteobacteria bacterium]|nr:LysR family transcriptional regulator [Alphaproteobacteria bacterium]
MDVDFARTLLAIVDAGSFKDAAGKLNVTQSTVSARMRALEDAVGRRLLERSKAGVRLTPAGEHFYRHSVTLVRVWRQAMLELALSERSMMHLAVGASVSLWEGFLLRWIIALRARHPEIAISASLGSSHDLMDRLTEGSLDLAIVYRASNRPGLAVEHIFDEEFVLVTSGDDADTGKPDSNYVFVNWGPEFAADHAETYPDLQHTGVQLELGAIGMNYLFDTPSSGYFPLRVAAPHVAENRLRIVKRARRFVYPVYAVFPDNHDKAFYGNLLGYLREMVDATAGLQAR